MSLGRRITEDERRQMFDLLVRGVVFRCQEEYEKVTYMRWGDKLEFKLDFTFKLDTAMLFEEKKR